MNKSMNPEKKWPIQPAQLVTDRLSCRWCGLRDSGVANNGEKCKHCGFVTEDYLRGILYSLYEKVGIPLVLFERICCPEFRLEALEPEDQAVYHVDGDCIYHQIDAAGLFRDKTFCFQCRTNPIFANGCLKTDLKAVKHIYKMFDSSNISLPEATLLNGEKLLYYHYRCPTTDLHELAFPIVVNGKLVAVAIVGQIVLGKELTSICKQCLEKKMCFDGKPCIDYYFSALDRNQQENKPDEHPHNIERGVPEEEKNTVKERTPNETMRELKKLFGKFRFSNIEEALEKIGVEINRFCYRMQERCKIRSSDFLYTKQGQYLRDLIRPSEKSENNNEFYDRIISVFQEISTDFDIDEMLVFLPDQRAILENQVNYHGKKIRNGNVEAIPTVLPIRKIMPYSIQNGKVNIKMIRDLLQDYEWVNNLLLYDFFAHIEQIENTTVLREQCGIAVLIKWTIEQTDKLYNAFFNVMLDACFASMMAQVARVKQNNLNVFRETTRHDLSQQLALIGQHCQMFKEDIIKFGKYEMTAQGFRQAAIDYQKEISRIETTLQHFSKTLIDDMLLEDYHPSSFLPYSRIIFNLAERYNAQRGRLKLNISLPSDDGDRFPEIIADQNLLERILINLLNNAFKYAYAYSQIYLNAHYNAISKEYIFKVINFGTAIPDEDAERIFDYGYRGTRNKDKSGSGFGLYNVRRFVEMHNGTISLNCHRKISSFHIPAMHRFEKMVEEQRTIRMITEEDDRIKDVLQAEKNRLLQSHTLLSGPLDKLDYSDQPNNDFETVILDMPITVSDSLKLLRKKVFEPTYCIEFEIRFPQ